MPFEIKELHIKVTVEKGSRGEATAQAGSLTGDKPGAGGGNPDVIAACVEQVLDILKEKMEA